MIKVKVSPTFSSLDRIRSLVDGLDLLLVPTSVIRYNERCLMARSARGEKISDYTENGFEAATTALELMRLAGYVGMAERIYDALKHYF